MNSLIPCIAKLKRITAKEVEDEMFMRDFSSAFLAKWTDFQSETIQLLKDFPERMNPGGEVADITPDDMRDVYQLVVEFVWDKRSRDWPNCIECKQSLADADACFRSLIQSVNNGVCSGSAVEAAWTQLENIQNKLAKMPKHLSWILPDGSLLELN